MELARFAQLGTQIAEKSLILKEEREKAAAILKGIRALEDELRPLVLEHTQMVSEMLGSVVQTVMSPAPQPAQAPSQTYMPPALPPSTMVDPRRAYLVAPSSLPPQARESDGIKNKIRSFLRRTETSEEGGLSANEIGEQLGVDPAIVREVLREAIGRR